MKTQEIKREFIRVIPQFTIQPNRVSLIAEEDNKLFKKGQLVMQVSRSDVYTMMKPLTCEILKRKGKDRQEKYITKIVTAENAPE